MADFGSIAIANSPAEFAQMLREGTDQWGAKALSHWSQAVTRHLRTESKLRTGAMSVNKLAHSSFAVAARELVQRLGVNVADVDLRSLADEGLHRAR